MKIIPYIFSGYTSLRLEITNKINILKYSNTQELDYTEELKGKIKNFLK
jgi:archaellum component FlaC